MKAKNIIFIIIFGMSCVIARESHAQGLKTEGKASQPYLNMGSDIKCYEVIYEAKNNDYAGYYKVIREKIMKTLKNLYRYYRRKGDVYLSFTLKSDGALTSFGVDGTKSTGDKALTDIAALSLRQASPFPPLPENLSLSQLSFNVIISFRDE